MTLTPDDIERQVFKERFRGYDQNEVDVFLDRVSDRLVELTQERDHLAEQLRQAQQDSSEATEAERLLKRTLIAAQRTADQTVEEARAQAEQSLTEAREQVEQLLTKARAEAEELLDDARRQAEELITDARREAAYEREQARAGADTVRRAVEQLRGFRSEYRERVRAVIAEQLELLDRAGDVPEPPPALDELSSLARSGEEAVGSDGAGGA